MAKAALDTRELLENEDDLLRQLLGFAAETSKTGLVKITRPGSSFALDFTIRPLDENEYLTLREKSQEMETPKGLGGMQVVKRLDQARYRCRLIYEATIPEDRKRIWDNKALWTPLRVLTGIDLVEKLLKAGEKNRVVDLIDKLSGYGPEADAEVEATAKAL